MNKKKSNFKKWIIGVVVIVIIAVVVIPLMKPSQISYESVNAKKGDITTYYSFSGNIETKNRQSVLSGKVLQIYDIKVKEGDIVEEDDELIRTRAGERIKAGIDGEVVDILVEDNEQVMSGMKLIEIVDYNNLQISVKVDEYDLSAVKKGKETTVKINALDKEIESEISSVSKEGNISSGVSFFTAIVDLKNDKELKTGMSAEVELIKEQAVDVVTVPMYAVQFDDDNTPYVLIEDDEGAIVQKEVETGINDGTTVEIKSGVSDGQTIYYSTSESLNSGFMSSRPNMNGIDGGDN
ncbi:MAG: efflux RND transporter periplasmic adaptor subunit [Eubacteriaceae bacterium]